jgi:ATP-dependent RNA helicase DeaD
LARNQNPKKSGGQGKNHTQNRRQDGTQSPRSQQEPKRSGDNQDNWAEDEFNGVLPSYGSFLKDMQDANDWGDDWDDDDTPIEKKVAAQKAEKANAQKKKKQSAAQPAAREKSPVAQEKQRNQDKKQQTRKQPQKAKPPVHEDERLFHNEDDRGLTLEEIDTSAECRMQNAESQERSGKRSDKQKQKQPPPKQEVKKQTPQKPEPQKQESKGKTAKTTPVAKKATPEPVAAPAIPVETTVPVEAVSKGGGVSLRVVATKSTMPSSSRRKRAEREMQNEESKTQSGKSKLQSAEHEKQRAGKRVQSAERSDKQNPDVRTLAPGAKRKTQSAKVDVPDNKGDKPPESKTPDSGGHGVTALPSKHQTQNLKTKPLTPNTKLSPTRAAIEPVDLVGEVEGKDGPSGFGNLKLSQTMLASLKAANYHEPSPVQAGLIPDVLAGRDVMGQARTGTGKTAAFCIPILEGLDNHEHGDEPVALILVPTRELAVQVRDEAAKLAKGRKVRIIACYGGKPIGDQITKLKNGVDIVVGTPGRVLDLSRRGALKLDALIWVVLDEADRMLDIGFRPDIEKILRLTPSDRQTLLLSATLPPDVVKLAERYMRDPKVIDFSDKQMAVETIDQYYITIDRDRKLEGLIRLIKEQQPKQAIVFCRTKRGADRVKRQLEDKFESLDSLHGDMTQGTRDRVMSQFRAGKLQILVATDVVGRGIDVTGISHIINYDIPVFCDDYVHRVGRTGRMGREGTAYTFVTAEEGQELTRIEMRINQLLKRAELKNFEAVSQIVPDDKEPPKPVFGKSTRRVRRAL